MNNISNKDELYIKNVSLIIKKQNNYINLNIDLNHIENNFNKHIKLINKLVYENNTIIEIINDIPVKLHLKCIKKVKENEYKNRYKLIIKFNSLFNSFLKEKYPKIHKKNIEIYYMDISCSKNNKNIISFYIIVSHKVGIFKNVNNIKILMQEFNKKLKEQKDYQFGDNFIDLTIYNNKIHKNIYTYNSNDINMSILNINNNFFTKSFNINNKNHFINSFIGYYGNLSTITILDKNVMTLHDCFNKLKL